MSLEKAARKVRREDGHEKAVESRPPAAGSMTGLGDGSKSGSRDERMHGRNPSMTSDHLPDKLSQEVYDVGLA
jgi:hypothetical protein